MSGKEKLNDFYVSAIVGAGCLFVSTIVLAAIFVG